MRVNNRKDMIIRGGENIYPKEIETCLLTHPKVNNVQVIGVPDKKYGEAVMARVKINEGVEITEQELINYCKGYRPLQNSQIFQICGRVSQNGNRKNQKSGDVRNKYQRAGAGVAGEKLTQ